jgi:hypothetical protein
MLPAQVTLTPPFDSVLDSPVPADWVAALLKRDLVSDLGHRQASLEQRLKQEREEKEQEMGGAAVGQDATAVGGLTVDKTKRLKRFLSANGCSHEQATALAMPYYEQVTTHARRASGFVCNGQTWVGLIEHSPDWMKGGNVE